jgi:hypothetical protein
MYLLVLIRDIIHVNNLSIKNVYREMKGHNKRPMLFAPAAQRGERIRAAIAEGKREPEPK